VRGSMWKLVLLSLVVMACGEAEERDEAVEQAVVMEGFEDAERVEVRMTEYLFHPERTEFVAGRPYLFVLINEGAEPHEWAVVPRGATDESQAYFEVEEDELTPGARVEVVYTFPGPGEYDFACFLPGHYEQGMVHPIVVSAGG
jgi:uncharacterized cupredoxin-like copper-binding protein